MNRRYSNNNRHFRGKPGRKPRPQKKQRKYTPPEPPKKCVVRYLPDETLMFYNKVEKTLEIVSFGTYTEFPSKRKAQIAIWHTVQKSGEPGSHVNYRIEEL